MSTGKGQVKAQPRILKPCTLSSKPKSFNKNKHALQESGDSGFRAWAGRTSWSESPKWVVADETGPTPRKEKDAKDTTCLNLSL